MIKILTGMAAGLLLAVVTMVLIEGLGNYLYGVSPDSSPSDQAPTIALLFPLVGWAAATLAGAWLAIRLSRRAWTGWIVAACIIAAVVANFLLQRYPAWLMVAGLIVPPIAGWLAQRLAGVRRVRISE